MKPGTHQSSRQNPACLCWLLLPNSAAISLHHLAENAVCTLPYHWFRRCLSAASLLSLIVVVNGCALWDKDRWSLDRYRDARSVDIERRLDRSEPIVKNPF